MLGYNQFHRYLIGLSVLPLSLAFGSRKQAYLFVINFCLIDSAVATETPAKLALCSSDSPIAKAVFIVSISFRSTAS